MSLKNNKKKRMSVSKGRKKIASPKIDIFASEEILSLKN